MWDAVAPVGDGYDPIICESPYPILVVLLNAGPGTIEVKAWDQRQPPPESPPQTQIELRAGGSRAVVGSLARLHLMMHGEGVPGGRAQFAAVAWRIARGMVWPA